MSHVTGHRGIAGAILLGGVFLAGCTGTTAAGKPAHAVASGAATAGRPVTGGTAVVDSFTARLLPRPATSYEVKYAGGGRALHFIVYAVRPGELLFRDTKALSGKARQVVVNASGEYVCRSPGHARWSCQKLDQAGAAAQNKSFEVYTAAHWAAFLRAFAQAPGFTRYHITTFTTERGSIPEVKLPASPAGWHCLDFSPPGTHGIDVICAVAPGILGLVTYHAFSIMIESYTPSPPGSMFVLPPGAKIVKPQAGAG